MSIFTKILHKEIPGHFVWEDDLCFSIMTIEPIRQGHLLVIPKSEINHWDDLPNDLAAHLMQVSQKIAKAMKAVITCKRIGFSIVGIEVPHAHLHLIPIDKIADLDFSRAKGMSNELLAETAASLNAELASQGYLEAEFE